MVRVRVFVRAFVLVRESVAGIRRRLVMRLHSCLRRFATRSCSAAPPSSATKTEPDAWPSTTVLAFVLAFVLALAFAFAFAFALAFALVRLG